MKLTPFCLLTCLRLSPDRSQFFMYDSFSLTCDNQLNSTSDWRVKRKTPEGGVRHCSSGWGSASSGSSCTIRRAYPSDSGVYWCESRTGECSNAVNVTVSDGSVILESPGLPVLQGDAVTLRCRPETGSAHHTFTFYKDGLPLGRGSAAEMTIHGVSKSDEGLYKCASSGGGESAESWMNVRASDPSSSLPPAASSSSVFRMLCHLVVGTPYLLSTVMLGLIYRDRKRAQTRVERRSGDEVVMETVELKSSPTSR
ncbi:hypothetical protein LDENG_00256010 [Lucifuga dentata]|nr:hypothetical protein LDENG_00256010 [Lucifuga dentata]